MISREIVLAAARGEAVDRVPVMYWINPHMAIRMMDESAPAENHAINRVGKFLWHHFASRR